MTTSLLMYFVIFISCTVLASLIYVLITKEPTCSWIRRFSGMQASGVNQASSALLVLCIAFLLNDVSQIRQKASDTLLLEADILRTMGRVSVNLSRDVGQPLKHLLVAYSGSILHDDWPRMWTCPYQTGHLDLSRIYAALIAHLGCLAFESQGAFASQR